jgi:hypothetical protein
MERFKGCGKTTECYGLEKVREKSISKLIPAEPALSLSNGDD